MFNEHIEQQIADQTMAELSPIMQDSMKEEEDIVLYRYEAKSITFVIPVSEWGIF